MPRQLKIGRLLQLLLLITVLSTTRMVAAEPYNIKIGAALPLSGATARAGIDIG